MRRLDLKSVNWVDGMLVSQADFLRQEVYHDESLQWLQRFGWPLYGIMPAPNDSGSVFQVFPELSQKNQLKVGVRQCRALTKDGSRIHIDDSDASQQLNPLFATMTINPSLEQVIPVYIRVVHKKSPVGEPDPAGNPPSRNHVYEILLDEARVPQDGSTLKVAEVNAQGGKVFLNSNYCPPCLTIRAVSQLEKIAEAIGDVARSALGLATTSLGKLTPGTEGSILVESSRQAHLIMATGWSSSIEKMSLWPGLTPPEFLIAQKSFLRLFMLALAANPAIKEKLDSEFLQVGGLPNVGGGFAFHDRVTQFISHPYNHETLGAIFLDGYRLLEDVSECLKFLAKISPEGAASPAVTKERVTYKDRDYYLLKTEKIDKSFTEDSQVLYFREMGTKSIRTVLFVLRNTKPDGAAAKGIRLRCGINDDRPIFCKTLEPDFDERPDQIFIKMDLEPNDRDNIEYISLRSSSRVIDLQKLYEDKAKSLRVYFL